MFLVEKPLDRDFVNSCPVPSGNSKDVKAPHKSSLTSSETIPSSIRTTPTVKEFTKCCIQLEVTKRRELFKMFGRKKPGAKLLPSRSESSSPDELNLDSYDIVNSSDIPSPIPLGCVSISTNSVPATPPSTTPTSTASRDVSPLPCNLSACHLKHSESDTPSSDTPSSEARDSSKPVLRGKSVDVSPTARPNSWSCLRGLRAVKIFGKRRPFQKFISDSQTKVFSLEQNEDSHFPPSFQWRLFIPNLLSKISNKQTKPVEEKFYARTQADNNKFCLELVLKLCPIGLDFERDSFCTLTVEVRNKNACNLSSQKLKLQVVVRAGEDCLKEVSKVCVIGESQRVPEFLSHEVLRCFKESWLELQFNLHLQYELDGEEATWEFIGRDFVL